LVKSAVILADNLEATAIIAFTRSGQLPRFAAAFRPKTAPIYAFCDSDHLAGGLALCRGVTPIVMPSCLTDAEGSIEGALARLKTALAMHMQAVLTRADSVGAEVRQLRSDHETPRRILEHQKPDPRADAGSAQRVHRHPDLPAGHHLLPDQD
jgi:pyruvate kinase